MGSIIRQWPRWAGYAAGAWSTGAVAVAVYWAGGRRAGNPLGGARPAAWLIAACLGTGGIMAVASVRDVARHMPRWWPLTGLWSAFGVAAAGTFGFVMNALQLAFTGTVDDWPAFGVEILCAAGAALLAGAALAYRRRTAGTCARCGRVHSRAGTVRGPAPVSAAPRGVRWAAHAGTLAFVPYVVMKTTWAFGGSFAGIEGERVVAEFERNGASGLVLTLEKYGLDFTTLSAALGVVLLLALTREWGQVLPRRTPFAGRGVPRWLLLAPAWLGALTLGPYGVVGTIGYLLPPVVGLGDLPDDPPLHGWSGWTVAACGIGAFAVYGTALGAAAWSYQRRTRPRCVSPGSPADGAPSGP